MKPIFQPATPIAHRKQHDILLGISAFIVVPIANILIIGAGKQSTLYNSLSRLAWPEKLLWLIYIWGFLNMGVYAYANHLAMRAGGYTRPWRRLVASLEIASGVIMTAGISIPAYADRGDYYEMLRTIHTAISSVGFFGFLVVLILLTITMIGRNRRQAWIAAMLNAFTIIVGVFFLVKVSDPASYCHVSAPSQILVFDMFVATAALNYYGMTLLPNEHKVADETPKDEEGLPVETSDPQQDADCDALS